MGRRTKSANKSTKTKLELQSDQLYIAVCFLYLVPWLVPCTRVCTVAYTGQVTFYKVSEQHGHVYLFSCRSQSHITFDMTPKLITKS